MLPFHLPLPSSPSYLPELRYRYSKYPSTVPITTHWRRSRQEEELSRSRFDQRQASPSLFFFFTPRNVPARARACADSASGSLFVFLPSSSREATGQNQTGPSLSITHLPDLMCLHLTPTDLCHKLIPLSSSSSSSSSPPSPPPPPLSPLSARSLMHSRYTAL